ncbi:MAG: ribosomal protein S18-alanine N-acetyltransferase [Rickettsiales bacterium]|nr:ribosomal protein S18-alanine N-acetyltransferase [Rickettsiales bacterium]
MSLKSDLIRLENASEQQLDLLTAIHQQCFTTYWNIEEFNDFFSVAGTYAHLAYAPQPVGMMVYRQQVEQADIITIAVLPDYRRQGVAKALLANAMAHLQQLGVETVFLDVEHQNQAALAFYEGFGFRHIRRRKNYYRQKDGTYTDALVMAYKFA